MDPQPLRIAQPIILTLHLRKHDLHPLAMPKEEIRDPTSTLLIFLRHDLAHRDQALGISVKATHHLKEILERKRPINTNNARLGSVLAVPYGADQMLGGTVADLDEALIDLAEPARVEGVGEEVERTALICGLEDVRHVREQDVCEQVPEQRAHDAAFAVVPAPAFFAAVVRQAHGLHAALAAAFVFVDPDRFRAAGAAGSTRRVRRAVAASVGRGCCALDADAGDVAFGRFREAHMQEIVLLAFGDFELPLELHDPFLQVVVVDQVAVAVLQAVFAGAKRDAFPMLFLSFGG